MNPPPLRCHLLIGPPGSGKSTLARDLAPLLVGENGEPALVLSTDSIRAELFGDAAVQGPWDEIRALLLQRLKEAVAVGTPVIIDATHARRPWRLLYTQLLALPAPVEWIGWWLTTPLDTCLEWASRRERPVPPAVIREFHAAIGHRQFQPSRAEGFAAIVTLNPAAGEATPAALQARLPRLDAQIRNAVNKQARTLANLHRHSRLLDLERLLFLLRLLTTFNGLNANDPATASALSEICNPPPVGDLAERAAAYLSRWSEVHGGNSDVYGDVQAIRSDLEWLEVNGFTRLDWDSDAPITTGLFQEPAGGGVNGGYPALADAAVFRRVFTLLRHILKAPFDAPPTPAVPGDGSGGEHAASQPRRGAAPGVPLYQHLIDRLREIEGSYQADQEAVLRKDLEGLLRPYGFAPEVKGRPHSLRHGYAIGTALLSADQLLEVYGLLKASMDRLSDASQKPLLLELQERLRRAGLLDEAAAGRRHSRRALAHRSFTEERTGTLAVRDQSDRIERAIRERRRVWLRHLPDVPQGGKGQPTGNDRFRAWPLQLLFHNISWYLAFEFDAIGTEQGLIRALRVDRLQLLGNDGGVRRHKESDHDRALERLERLLDVCGGLWFGNDLEGQLALMPARTAGSADGPEGSRASSGSDWLDTLRFSCTPRVFSLIREEPNRYPPEHTAYARPIANVSSWPAGPLDRLEPNAANDSHPYPVELRLPRWTVAEDWDLRSWLFRWGNGVRIEQPLALREQHLEQSQGVVELYRQPVLPSA